MNKLIYSLLVFIICLAACKKDSTKPPVGTNTGIKMIIQKGANQTDTVGNLLKDSIIIRVTENGAPAQNYTLQFKRSGCGDLKTIEKSLAGGSAQYSWYLSGEQGKQSLNVILIDNNLNRKDSITVTATGIAASHGWHRSGCVQNFPVNSLSKLSSGRIITSLNGLSYPYFSDDNGVSFRPLKNFSNNYFITKILAVGTNNEAFLATQNSGIFYSKNGGVSWANRTAGITDPTGFTDIAYTKKGRLIFCAGTGVYISDDKGISWNDVSFGLPLGQCTNPCEQLNGDLYIIGSDAELYKSTNEGTTWVNQGSSVGNYLLASVESLYIDNSGNMYIGSPHNGAGANGDLYKSADKGTTWVKVFSQPSSNSSFPNITQISAIGSHYYFSFAGRGIYETADFANYTNNTGRFAGYGVLSYTLAANSAFLVGSPGFGAFYYIK